MQIKVLLALVGIALSILGYIPYIRDIRAGKTLPHSFSWLIWSLLGYIAVAAQITAGGGVGTLVTLSTSTISLGIGVYAIRAGTFDTTRGDWISLVAALIAIPLWLITKQPLLSVILVSLIDLVGFWPTISKTYKDPHGETLSTHIMATIKHCLAVASLQSYSLVTVLFPLSNALATATFVGMIVVRRNRTKR